MKEFLDFGASLLEIGLDQEAAPCHIIIKFDGLRLLVSQQQVYALEPIFDMVKNKSTTAGRIVIDDIDFPVYCLSETLHVTNIIPDTRRICVLFHTEACIFGLLCDEVVLADWLDNFEIYPIPSCMQTPDTRLQGFILQDDEVVCVISAEDLAICCEITVINDREDGK